MTVLALVLGVGLGCLHVFGIWRASLRPTWLLAIGGMARIAAIAGGLTLAALFGELVPCLIGWGLCVFTSVLVACCFRPLASR